MNVPTFSIIIPVKPGGAVAALAPLRNVAGSDFEILIAEGSSPSKQRNLAAWEAAGEIIYFLDDDSLVPPQALAVIAETLADGNVAAVGGPSLTPPGDSMRQQLFGAALSSFLGAGAVRNRYRAKGTARRTTDKELILCNLAMRRKVFLEFGGFDERLYPNEENELLDRIAASGLTLIHEPRLAVQRSQRSTLRRFIRQMFSYGRGRAQQTLISKQVSIASFAPLVLLLYLAGLVILPPSPAILAPLGAYTALVLCFSLHAAVTQRSLSRLLLIALYPVMHCANGWGLLTGLAGGRRGRSSAGADVPVAIRRVKELGQTIW